MLNNDIAGWIAVLDIEQPALSQNKICPFAKSAKFKLIECVLSEVAPPAEDFDLVIFKVEPTASLGDLVKKCEELNVVYKDIVFLPDHKDRDTFLNGVKTNNGKHNLLLCQYRRKLDKARAALLKTNYYSFWNKAYLEEIMST
jgi:hypothetical protein